MIEISNLKMDVTLHVKLNKDTNVINHLQFVFHSVVMAFLILLMKPAMIQINKTMTDVLKNVNSRMDGNVTSPTNLQVAIQFVEINI